MTNWNLRIELDSKQDGFATSQTMTLFHDHITSKELTETLSMWKKHIKKITDKSDLMISLVVNEDNNYCNSKSLHRFCIRRFMVDGTYELESRPYTGTDFSKIHKLNFVRRSDMINYVVKLIEDIVRQNMLDIPEEESRYTVANFK